MGQLLILGIKTYFVCSIFKMANVKIKRYLFNGADLIQEKKLRMYISQIPVSSQDLFKLNKSHYLIHSGNSMFTRSEFKRGNP